MYLVDTSAWIDFLKGKDTKCTKAVEKLIDAAEVGIEQIIYNEICYGARDENQFKKFSKYFREIPFYSTASWHLEVAEMRFYLKRKGVTSYIPDTIIAYTALSNNIHLLTKDKDFIPFQKHFDLKLVLV